MLITKIFYDCCDITGLYQSKSVGTKMYMASYTAKDDCISTTAVI